MSRQSILFTGMPALAVAGLLLLAQPSQAQHHGGGGHGGGHAGGAHAGGWHGGGAPHGAWHGGAVPHSTWHGGYYGGYHGGYYGYRYGGYPYGYRYGAYPYYYGYRHNYYPYFLLGLGYLGYYGYLNPWSYGYGYPGYYGSYGGYGPSYDYDAYPWSSYWSAYPEAMPYSSLYGTAPASSSGAYAPRLTDTAVHVDVRVPTNAVVWFNNAPTTQKGALRRFESAPLEPGSDYTYDIRARWMENGRVVDQTRHFVVHAGEQLYVDFLTPTQSSAAASVPPTTP